MATFTFTLQGTTPTTIDATDILQFAAATFGSAITVGAYNDTTHVESNVGANDSSGNSPKNAKFISQSGGTGGHSQVNVGAGTVDLDTVSTANSPLKINFSHGSAVAVTGWTAYFYDGSTPANAPSGVTVKLAEQGENNFTAAAGSGTPVNLADGTSATSHDRYLIPSVSPDSVGLKSFGIRTELTYS